MFCRNWGLMVRIRAGVRVGIRAGVRDRVRDTDRVRVRVCPPSWTVHSLRLERAGRRCARVRVIRVRVTRVRVRVRVEKSVATLSAQPLEW